VHEEETFGSDHQLITFKILFPTPQHRPSFQRLNIRKLREEKEEYATEGEDEVH
jgi:hypothetical protein